MGGPASPTIRAAAGLRSAMRRTAIGFTSQGLKLEGVQNFRDLGGYETSDGARLRWRTVYRSSTLCEATPADVQRLLDLDLTLVLDLRSDDELERTGISTLHEHGVDDAVEAVRSDDGGRGAGATADAGRSPRRAAGAPIATLSPM